VLCLPTLSPPLPRRSELTKCLLAVFSQFGPVRQVVSGKAHKLRGQAWVVFQSMEAAVEAKALMEGFPLYEKPLVRGPRSHVSAG